MVGIVTFRMPLRTAASNDFAEGFLKRSRESNKLTGLYVMEQQSERSITTSN